MCENQLQYHEEKQNTMQKKMTHIRVSTANCCDFWTEGNCEEGTDVKPFAGDESACMVCVD